MLRRRRPKAPHPVSSTFHRLGVKPAAKVCESRKIVAGFLGCEEDEIVFTSCGSESDNLAILGPDQFFMAGDNSTASSDSRLWGNPHPVVAQQIDPAPFVVNRELLLGKAWVVYFPAPHAMTQGGRALIPEKEEAT